MLHSQYLFSLTGERPSTSSDEAEARAAKREMYRMYWPGSRAHWPKNIDPYIAIIREQKTCTFTWNWKTKD